MGEWRVSRLCVDRHGDREVPMLAYSYFIENKYG